MEKNAMSKLFWKTVWQTILAVVLIVVIVCGCIVAFAPGVAARELYRLRWHSAGLKLTEAQYLKSSDINDLATLLDRAIAQEGYDLLETYVPQMTQRTEYAEFVAFQDGRLQLDLVLGYDNYIRRAYVTALYQNGKKQEAYTYAMQQFPASPQDGKYTWALGAYLKCAREDASGEIPQEAVEKCLSLAKAEVGGLLYDDYQSNHRESSRNFALIVLADLYESTLASQPALAAEVASFIDAWLALAE